MPYVPDQALLWPRDVFWPRAQASSKIVRPLIRSLENDSIAFPANRDFLLLREPARLGKSDGLAPAVLEQLRAGALHRKSIDVCLYMVKRLVTVSLSAERCMGGSRQTWLPLPRDVHGSFVYRSNGAILLARSQSVKVPLGNRYLWLDRGSTPERLDGSPRCERGTSVSGSCLCRRSAWWC